MSLRPSAQVTERFWVVWSPERGCPTRKHETQKEAITEAERLAEKHKGFKFHVLEHIGFAQKVVPSTFTYVSE